MKETVYRLGWIQGAALLLCGLAGFLWLGGPGALAMVVGGLAFALPVLGFSGLIVQAADSEPSQFIGRFFLAEALKWVSAGTLFALVLISRWFVPEALLAGFLALVAVQLVFPIFVRKARAS